MTFILGLVTGALFTWLFHDDIQKAVQAGRDGGDKRSDD